jgi:N-methylhydantoinase B
MLEGELNDQGDLFAYIYFSAGGMGARANRDGLSATAFPSGITGVPVEVIEAVAPVRMHKRELRIDSGGPGQYRGGLGQAMELEVITGRPAVHSPMYDRTQFPARGFMGGQAGAVGEIELSDGSHPHPKTRYLLQPHQRVTLRLPGGGGFYSPLKRDPLAVLADVRQGYVSLEAAEQVYGVVIDVSDWTIDEAATARLRSA